MNGQHLNVRDQRGFRRIAGRDTDAPEAFLPRFQGYGKNPAHMAYRSVEGQLSDDQGAFQFGNPVFIFAGKLPDGDGQVEAGTFLAQIRGSQVDGDALTQVLQPGVADRSADAFFALLYRQIRQTDDNRPRFLRTGNINFDFDDRSRYAGDGA